MSSSEGFDWEKKYPLNSDQVDEYLRLQEEASDIRNILQLNSNQVKNEVKDENKQDKESENVLADALQSFSLSKYRMIDSASWISDPFISRINRKINQRIKTSDEFSAKLSKALCILEGNQTQIQNLSDKTEELLSATQRLSKEKQQIETIAQEIESHLSQFTFLEEVSALLRQSVVQHPDLFLVLEKLHACLTFMQKNRQFTDAALYETRYRQCLLRIISEFHHHLLTSFEQWLLNLSKEAPPNFNMVELLVFYQTGPIAMQFKQLCAQLKPYAQEIEKCCPDNEFDIFRKECVVTYIQARTQWVMPLVRSVIEMNYDPDKVNRATELCGFVDTMVEEESSVFKMIFDSKYLQDINPLFIALSKSILDVLFRSDFSNSIEELSTLLHFLLLQRPSDPNVLDPLKEFTEKNIKHLADLAVSICSNEDQWDPSEYMEKMPECRALVKNILPFDFQVHLLSLIHEACNDILTELENPSLAFFQSINQFREILFEDLQVFESTNIPPSSIVQFKQHLLEFDTMLIEVQESLVATYTNKCMNHLIQFTRPGSSFDSRKSISTELILEVYNTWFCELQVSVAQIHEALADEPSLFQAFHKSIENTYTRFYQWIHAIHPNSEFSNMMSVNQFIEFLISYEKNNITQKNLGK